MAVVLQRLLELRLASRNARYLRSIGGYEVGADHYKYIVFLHVGFCRAAGRGHLAKRHACPLVAPVFFALSIRADSSLLVYPDSRKTLEYADHHPSRRSPITRGPYRYIRHPNYWIVTIELFTLPLTFSAYVTAMFFTICNLWLLLRVRIPAEERAVYKHR